MIISLAPMEGITTYIYRNAIAKYYGGIDRYYTPFLTASHLKGRELRDVHPDNNKGLDLVPQILTNDSELFLTITRQLADLGYTEVNLNLGCPSGTVVSKGRGAGFLDYPDKLDKFLYDIFEGCNDKIQISIKTRIGMDFLSEWEDILKVYIKYPIKELIIHPRLRNEFYDGEVHLEAFDLAQDMFSVEGVSSKKKLTDVDSSKVKLCYNGDIIDKPTFSNVISIIRDDDPYIMIGRGLLMNPNLANELKSGISPEFDKKRFSEFLSEITDNYIEEMSSEKQVVMKMKELWTYIARGLNLDKKQLKEIYKCTRFPDYKNTVQMILQGL